MASGSSQEDPIPLLDDENDEDPMIIRFQPSYKTLTDSGKTNFSRVPDACAELIDNAIQATAKLPERRVRVVVVKCAPPQPWWLFVVDNGCGMDLAALKNFARYRRGPKDRRDGPEQEAAAASAGSGISKYGVGAKDAGFFLSRRIRVATKAAASEDVLELVLDERLFAQRERAGEEVFRDRATRRRPGEPTNKLRLGEAKLTQTEAQLCDEEVGQSHFTRISLELRMDVHSSFFERGGEEALLRELGGVYHFFCRPEDAPEAVRSDAVLFAEPVDIQLEVHDETGANDPEPQVWALRDEKASLVSQLKLCRAKDREYEFTFELRNPDKWTENPPEWLTVHGVTYYYPFDEKETNPRHMPLFKAVSAADESDDAHESQIPPVTIFWQGRHIPETSAKVLPFFPTLSQMAQSKNREDLGQMYSERIHTFLFFPYETPVSVNKLKLLLGTSLDEALMNPNVTRFETPSLDAVAKAFREWLRRAHSQCDKDAVFSDLLGEDSQTSKARWGRVCFAAAAAAAAAAKANAAAQRSSVAGKSNSGKKAAAQPRDTFEAGQRVRLGLRTYKYGVIKYFETDSNNMRRRGLRGQESSTDRKDGKVVFERQPTEKYGVKLQCVELRDLNPSSAVMADKDWETALEKERAGLPQRLEVTCPALTPKELPDILSAVVGQDNPGLTLKIKVVSAGGVSLTKHWADGELLLRRQVLQKQQPDGQATLLLNEQKSVMQQWTTFGDKVQFTNAGDFVMRISLVSQEASGAETDCVVMERPLQVTAGVPTSAKLNFEPCIAVLEEEGCRLPAFQVQLKDANGNDCKGPDGKGPLVDVSITCDDERLAARLAEGGKKKAVRQHSFKLYPEGLWVAKPLIQPLLSSKIVHTGTFIFKVEIKWGGRSQTCDWKVNISPGPPDTLCVISPEQAHPDRPLFEVRNFETLPDVVVAVFDANGNRTVPESGEAFVKLDLTGEANDEDSHPFQAGSTAVPLEDDGEVTFAGLAARFAVSIAKDGMIMEVIVRLGTKEDKEKSKARKRSSQGASQAEFAEVLCDTAFTFRLLPSIGIPFKAVVKREGESWPRMNVSSDFKLRAGAEVTDLKLAYQDQAGEQVALSPGLFDGKHGISISWDSQWDWQAALAAAQAEARAGEVYEMSMPPIRAPTEIWEAAWANRAGKADFIVDTTIAEDRQRLDKTSFKLHFYPGPARKWCAVSLAAAQTAASSQNSSASSSRHTPLSQSQPRPISGYVSERLVRAAAVQVGESCGDVLTRTFGVVYLGDEHGNRVHLPGVMPLKQPRLLLENVDGGDVRPDELMHDRATSAFVFPAKLLLTGKPLSASGRDAALKTWLTVQGPGIDIEAATDQAAAAAAATEMQELEALRLPLKLLAGRVVAVQVRLAGASEFQADSEAVVGDMAELGKVEVRLVDRFGNDAFVPSRGVDLSVQLRAEGAREHPQVINYMLHDSNASVTVAIPNALGRAVNSGPIVLTFSVKTVNGAKPVTPARLTLLRQLTGRVTSLVVRAVTYKRLADGIAQMLRDGGREDDIAGLLSALEEDPRGPNSTQPAAAAAAAASSPRGGGGSGNSVFAAAKTPEFSVDALLPPLVLWAVDDGGSTVPLTSDSIQSSVLWDGKACEDTHSVVPTSDGCKFVILACKPQCQAKVGLYRFEFTYSEQRENVQFQHIAPAAAQELKAVAGQIAHLWPERAPKLKGQAGNMPGNAAAAVESRLLCKRIAFGGQDARNNIVRTETVPSQLVATIVPSGEEALLGQPRRQQWPCLQGSNENGWLDATKREFVEGFVLAPDLGTEDGDYDVVVMPEASDACREWRHSFTFKTKADELKAWEELEKRLEPLRQQRDAMQAAIQAAEDACAQANDCLKRSVRALPQNLQAQFGDVSDLKHCQAAARQNRDELEAEIHAREGEAARPARVDQAAQAEVTHRLQNSGVKPLGFVVTTAFVEDPTLAEVLSWAAGGQYMSALVVKTTEERNFAMEKGIGTFAIEGVKVFDERGGVSSDGRLLLPEPPADGFKGYAVNLLDLPVEKRGWRRSLFWSIFNRTMVFDTLANASKYQKEVKNKVPGTLFTLDGRRIDSSGYGSGQKCNPATLRNIFGQLTPNLEAERSKLAKLEGVLAAVEASREAKDHFRAAEQKAAQAGYARIEEEIRKLEAQMRRPEARGGAPKKQNMNGKRKK